MVLHQAVNEPEILGRIILLRQLRRAAKRTVPAAILALPLLVVDTPRLGDWTIAAVLLCWAAFHTVLTARHVWKSRKQELQVTVGGPLGIVARAWGAGTVGCLALYRPWDQPRTSTITSLVVLVAIAVALSTFSLLIAFTKASRDLLSQSRTAGLTAGTPKTQLSTAPTPIVVAEARPTLPHRGVAIACSGGGIRSAAFCLGGLQRLIADGIYDRAHRVYAISGGSYIAAALHLARRHSNVNAGEPPIFAPDSPEADWLRRRSSYLIPTPRTLARGLLALANGIVANVGMLLSTMWLVTAYACWLLDRLPGQGVAVLNKPVASYAVSSLLECVIRSLLALSVFWLLCAVVQQKYFRSRMISLGGAVASGAAAITLALALVLIPKIAVLAHNSTISNKPTATVAKVLSTLGLAQAEAPGPAAPPEMTLCDIALRTDFIRQAQAAWLRTPKAAQESDIPFSYGACGDTGTDNAALFPLIAAPGDSASSPAKRDGAIKSLKNFRCPSAEELVRGDASSESTKAVGPLPSFCSVQADTTGGIATGLTTLAALATALAALMKRVRESTPEPSTRSGKVSAVLRRTVLPWTGLVLALTGLGVLGILMGRRLSNHTADLDSLWTYLAPISFLLLVRVLNDATNSSLHPFYRERLADTFLVKRDATLSTSSTATGVSRLDADSECAVDPGGPTTPYNPALTILCAANLGDVDYIPSQRGCATFRFETPSYKPDREVGRAAYIGLTDRRLPTSPGPRCVDSGEPPIPISATAYSREADPQDRDTTLAVAMAASGAAFSPIVGRQQRLISPYRLLMTLVNARLGIWLPNPYYALARQTIAQQEPGASTNESAEPGLVARGWWRLVRKPGPYRVFKESMGQQSVTDTRIYVTDGGHFDNTGIVEALRDRPKVLIALDASADPTGSLSALSDAITTARMDLGLIIRPHTPGDLAKLKPPTPDDLPTRPWIVLDVAAEDDPEKVVATIYFVKNTLSLISAAQLAEYRRKHPEFPVTTTVNQFYGEYDFEAYRLLGYLSTSDMCDATALRSAVKLSGRDPEEAATPEPAS